MPKSTFSAKRICPRLIRRRAGEELLQLMAGVGVVLATRGRSLTWNSSFPNRMAYHMAMCRLREAGLIAYRREGGRQPVLVLTEEGRAILPAACRSRFPWKRKWDGIWYVLIYDVPERNRVYRRALQGFLARLRMGCLQRSVWITPHDIRPEYDDLVRAAGVNDFSFLLQARGVQQLNNREMVRQAWDFETIAKEQAAYRTWALLQRSRLEALRPSSAAAAALAREEQGLFLAAMRHDPLLPVGLWPEGYLGRTIHQLHLKMVSAIGRLC